MSLTTAQRIDAIDAAIDAVLTALTNNDGVSPIDLQYIQDPDGGQLSFRSPKEAVEYVESLRNLRALLVDDQSAETAGVTAPAAFPIIRRRFR